jgi:hypothetical protein
MATTALTIQSQITNLQTDIRTTLEEFFASLPEMETNVNMSTALVAQSKAITVFQRDNRGQITVSDATAFVSASEQVQALKSVSEEIEDLMKPFIDRLFKAHRTATAIRKQYLDPIDGEVTRLKREREQFAAEEERKRREAALKAQEEARKAEEARLLAEAQAAQAEGDSVAAEAILEEATHVEAPPVILPSTVPTVTGTNFFTHWEYEVQDWTKLKPEFIKVDDVAIGKIVRSMRKAAETVCGEKGAIRVWSEQRIKG